MSEIHTIELEKYRGPASKHTCPSCKEKKKLSLYVYTTTGAYVSDTVGRCDRENSCGYHYTPKQFFADNPKIDSTAYRVPSTHSTNGAINTNSTHSTQQYAAVQYLPFEVMDKTIVRHRHCNLYPYLVKLFGEDVASGLCNDYFIGANKDGNTAFWQVDTSGNIRQVKVMQYNPITGRRNKETGAFFGGKKILKDDEAHLQQCFFGEYLLCLPEHSNKPVAIAESEKTAVIASVYYPQFLWIATGGKYGCKWTEQSVCKALKGRKVILFPDLGAYDNWKAKGLLLAAVSGCKVAVSDTLERIATDEERTAGYDIADYLLRTEDSTGLAMTDDRYPVIWDYK